MQSNIDKNNDIFICYSRSDWREVKKVVELLKSYQIKVWFDTQNLETATIWSTDVVEAIKNSFAILAFISPNSMASQNVQKEITLASELGKHIIPIYIQQTDIPANIMYHLTGIQRLDLGKDNEITTTRRVLSSLKRLGMQLNIETIKFNDKSTTSKTTNFFAKIPLKLIITVCILCIFSIILLLSITPVGNNFRNQFFSKNGKPTVYILPIFSETLDSLSISLYRDLFKNELFMAGRYTLVDRDMMKEILTELGFSQTGTVDSNTSLEIDKIIAVQKLIKLSIEKTDDISGTHQTVIVNRIDVETSIIENTITKICESCGLKEIRSLLMVAAKEI